MALDKVKMFDSSQDKNKSVLFLLLAFASSWLFMSTAWADTYILIMSKDDEVCQHMLSIYNLDLHTQGELKLENHEEYSSIPWDTETQIMSGSNHIRYTFAEHKVALYDINNDGKNESVLFIEYPYIPGVNNTSGEYLEYFPEETMRLIKSGIEISELYKKLRIGKGFRDQGGGYPLKELPIQGVFRYSDNEMDVYVDFDRFMNIRPFIYNNTAYLSLFNTVGRGVKDYPPFEEHNFISIGKYQPDNTLKDICYYAKMQHVKQGEE